jgi:MFS family permease
VRKEQVRLNVPKLYFIKAVRSFMLMLPVIVLFFKENGLDMKEIFLLQALFSLTVIILEIPTGYFSDTFGRKLSILIGGSIATLGWIVYALAYGFWQFLVAETILGFGLSFVSGADSAMLYDTLLELSREFEYQKVEGRGLAIGVASEGLSSIIGGLLALISLRFPLYWDAAVSFLIIPIALTLTKTQRRKKTTEKKSLKNMLALTKYYLHDHASVKWLIFYSAFVSTSTMVMFWFTQPYLISIKIPLEFFGAISAVLLATSAIFSWNAHRMEKHLGQRTIFLMLIALPTAGYFLLSSFSSVWCGVFLLLFYVTRGINNPVSLDYINRLVLSDVRATVLSARNLVGRVIFSIVGPLLGWISDVYSLKIALLVSGLTFLVLGLISLCFLRKHKVL